MTHHQKTSKIRKEINASYRQLKEKYPFLKHQNLIGFFIFFSCIVLTGLSAYLWWVNILPTWAMVLINAFLFGILHEIEHDLIHWMYFKNNKFMHHLMLGVVWLVRPVTVNPWIRRTLHYHHHKYSGTPHDVEERSVTNGEKWTLKRLLTTPDVVIGGVLRLNRMFKDMKKEVELGNLKMETSSKLKRILFISLIPFTIVSHVILYTYIADGILNFLNNTWNTGFVMPQSIKNILQWLNPVIWIVLIPNMIRQFCLHFITSNMHYFGDVEDGNVIEQTQVLNVWWTFPMQIFCFFFGWTHTIHHFVVNETFYVRHIGRKKAYIVLKENGVRFNDLGTFKRANRFNEHHS